MNERHLSQFETQLERLIEGAFAQIFGRRVRAQDVAVQLARAMENSAQTGSDGRPLVADLYTIHLNPLEQRWLLQQQPQINTQLAAHLVELAAQSGYLSATPPRVEVLGDEGVSKGAARISASRQSLVHASTSVMQPVNAPQAYSAPRNPRLIVNGKASVPLGLGVVNVGRGQDNHIVLDDAAVSRHHLQLRLRFGRYVLFDTQSSSGTFINQTRVREHLLQTGDVIVVGETQLLYVEDHQYAETQVGGTLAGEN